MSETETSEPDVPGVADVPEPDQEPHEPIPNEADQELEEDEHEDEQGAGEPAQASGPPVDAAKEQRRIASALKREQEAHGRKLEKILGEAHEHVLACPLCGDGLQGFVFPGDGQMIEEETKALVLAFIGEAGPVEYREAEGVEMCDRCDGYGQLKFPTRNPHVTTQQCPKCAGQGYVPTRPAESNVTQLPAPSPQTYTAATGSGGPCPICGAPNQAGLPHFCNPVAQPAGV